MKSALSGCSAQLPVLVAAEQRPGFWIWFRIQAGKQGGQLHKAEGERGVEMTAEPWWRCQEAASPPFINCHRKPRLPLSRLQNTRPFMDSSRMYFSSFSPPLAKHGVSWPALSGRISERGVESLLTWLQRGGRGLICAFQREGRQWGLEELESQCVLRWSGEEYRSYLFLYLGVGPGEGG